MITVYNKDGDVRVIHPVDLSGYLGLGWSTERTAIAPSVEQADQEITQHKITADEIRALSWRDQKSLLTEAQQNARPDGVGWEDYAIALLTGGESNG